MANLFATESADTVALDEVTVTALKVRTAVATNSPVTVIGESEARDLHLVGMKGVSEVAPNFFIPEYGSRMTSSIYVRGIGARIDQPAVGLSVDNVPIMNKDAYDFDLSDIHSIQVLRGPQSILFGRNTMAGLISISTLSPFDFTGLRASLEYGRANSAVATASAYSVPKEDLGLSLSLRYAHSDGFFTNAYTSQKIDYQNNFSARTKLYWLPSSRLKLLNTLAAAHLKQGGYPYMSVASGQIAYNDTCAYRRTTLSDGLSINYFTDNINLSSVTSWQFIDDAMNLDQDFLPDDYFVLLQAKRENALTQDFMLTSRAAAPYEWLTGLFFFYKHLNMDAPVTFHDYGISQLIEQHRNEANPYYPIRWRERSFILGSHFCMPTYGAAIYHQSEYKYANWQFSAALRLDYEHTSLRYNSFTDTGYEILYRENLSAPLQPYRYVSLVINEQGKLHNDYLQLLPKLSASYKLSNGLLSASIAKGYKSGGYNTQMFSDVLQQQLMWLMGIGKKYDVDQIVSYKPETSWNYELGWNFNTRNQKFSSTLNIFYIDVRNQQLTMFPEGNTTGRIMTNAGRARSAGVEVTANYLILDNLLLKMSYGFTDARFRDFYNGREQFRGKIIPYAPKNTLFLNALYTLRLNEKSSLDFDVNMRAAGKIYWNESNSIAQPFYALLGASAAWSNDLFRVELWGKNLSNTKYSTFYFVSIGHEFLQRGRPIEYGITLNININK